MKNFNFKMLSDVEIKNIDVKTLTLPSAKRKNLDHEINSWLC